MGSEKLSLKVLSRRAMVPLGFAVVFVVLVVLYEKDGLRFIDLTHYMVGLKGAGESVATLPRDPRWRSNVPQLPDWGGRLALLHIQKTGGTSLFISCAVACEEREKNASHFKQHSLEELLKHNGHNFVVGKAGEMCGCGDLFDVHYNWFELNAMSMASENRKTPFWTITLLRDPVSRVVSEYNHLMAHPRAAENQDQWDYDASGNSGCNMGQLIRSKKIKSLSDFLNACPPSTHPAFNRQTRYLAGFRRKIELSENGCCLRKKLSGLAVFVRRWVHHSGVDGALGNLLNVMRNGFQYPRVGPDHLNLALKHLLHDGSISSFGLTEKMDETMQLFAHQFGWKIHDDAKHIQARKDKKDTEISPQVHRKILELNKYDTALYKQAEAEFSRRIDALRAPQVNRVSFIVVGAQKAGTSYTRSILRKYHEGICIWKREGHFWDFAAGVATIAGVRPNFNSLEDYDAHCRQSKSCTW